MHRPRRIRLALIGLCATLLATGCASVKDVTIPHVERVELPRFVGRWYVIASIPTAIEKDAYNAVETYELAADGTIPTTFTFSKGGFDGKPKRYTPKGFVLDAKSNAIWGMRFVWPVKAEYVISHVDEAYTETIIARSARDYVWIMARTPTIPAADYDRLVERVRALGYDVSKLNRVPQRWP